MELINKSNYPEEEVREAIRVAKASESLKGWKVIVKNGKGTGSCFYRGSDKIIVRIGKNEFPYTYNKTQARYRALCEQCNTRLEDTIEITQCPYCKNTELKEKREIRKFSKYPEYEVRNWKEELVSIMTHEIHHKIDSRKGIGLKGYCHVRCENFAKKRLERYREKHPIEEKNSDLISVSITETLMPDGSQGWWGGANERIFETETNNRVIEISKEFNDLIPSLDRKAEQIEKADTTEEELKLRWQYGKIVNEFKSKATEIGVYINGLPSTLDKAINRNYKFVYYNEKFYEKYKDKVYPVDVSFSQLL